LPAPTKAGRERRGGGRRGQAGGGREEYYTRELATDHEAYLSGHGESPGRWYGAGAVSLGLQGEASPADFRRMFEGRHPDSGELLGRPHGRSAVPAFDVVLRPTKSVSILYGLGKAATGRAVLVAHHAGVREAVAYLDGQLGARRGHGGVQHVQGQGLLAVGFDHRTSREGDPLLHTHLVVANRVQGPDGRWTALDGRDLYRHRLAADAIYRARYQRQLVRTLRVEWTVADRHGNRELQGLPEDLLRVFSKRTDQIDLEVERLEASGRERTPRLVKWAVHAIRKAKQQEAPDTLYERWRTEAAERGVDADAVVRQVTGRTLDRDQQLSEWTVSKAFDRLAGPDGLTATASTFARQDVIAALGALVLLITLAIRRQSLPHASREWVYLAGMAVLANIAPYLLFSWSEQRISSGLAGALSGTTPLLTLLLARGFGVGRLTPPRVLGLALGLAGVLLLAAPWHDGSRAVSLAGVLAALGAAACYAGS
jgi:conjugative relaxase-like TrwC/TraI family protein